VAGVSVGSLRPGPGLQVSRCVTAQRGLQRRSVPCVHRGNGSAASARVCEAFSPPPEAEQACLLPCPLDCVVSAFSNWSPCSRTCGPALQQRTRHVLAPPLYGGVECPDLTDTRPCNHDNNHPARCPSDQQEHSYSLWAGPWSSCRRKGTPPSGRTTVDFSSGPSGTSAFRVLRMGRQHHRHDNDHIQHQHHEHQRDSRGSWEVHVGYQTRQLRCTRSDGKNTMLSLCDSENVPVNFRSCAMPRDCEVSDWSAWSACSKSCSSVDQVPGFRSRTRGVRGVPAGGGEECPGLEEVQTCNTAGELLPHCPR
uniref:Spondin-like TSP1 domain-containing protein n=1 Tax=Astyanax mexicanus TaxID=7994 RepID=A0A3B1K1Z6_ASTMX